MQIIFLDVFDDIDYYEGNPTLHDIAEIKASVKRYGFARIMVKSGNEVIAGNGGTEALRELYGEDPHTVPSGIMVDIHLSELQKDTKTSWLVPVNTVVSNVPDGYIYDAEGKSDDFNPEDEDSGTPCAGIISLEEDAKPVKSAIIRIASSLGPLQGRTVIGSWYAPYFEKHFASEEEKLAFVFDDNISALGGSGADMAQKLGLFDAEAGLKGMQILEAGKSKLSTLANMNSVKKTFADMKAGQKLTHFFGNKVKEAEDEVAEARADEIAELGLEDDPESTDDLSGLNHATGEEGDPTHYLSVSYQLLKDERTQVMRVLNHIKQEHGLVSSNDALVKLSETYEKDYIGTSDA